MDEEGVGSEGILTKAGVLTRFNGGEIVFNSEEMQNLLDIAAKPNRFIEDIVARSMSNYKIPDYEIHPVNREQKIEVNMNIGGVLDEAAARVLNNEFPNMIKKHQRQIGAAAYKDMGYTLYGK